MISLDEGFLKGRIRPDDVNLDTIDPKIQKWTTQHKGSSEKEEK